MNRIAKVKNEVRVRQWAEIVQHRKESGLTVTQCYAECERIKPAFGDVRIYLPNDTETLARLLGVLR